MIADGWLPIFAPRHHMGPLRALFESAVRSAGRDPAVADVAAYIPALLGPAADTLLRQQLAYYIGGMGTFYYHFLSRTGFGQDAEEIRRAWQQGDPRTAVAAVSDHLLDACTVSGEPSAARTAVDGYRESGIRLPILTPPHGSSPAEVAATLEALAPIPIIRP
jgi:alkanesulfonate monooxygenase SsuD/methylene tetrahydromethanopterin reductase-like flavin-dependent oxidoreductase (luciferase family)